MTIKRYLLSVPERSLRAGVAVTAGAFKTAADHVLPQTLRGSHSYAVIVGRLERFLVETVGGVQGVYDEAGAAGGSFVLRKTAGNVVELATLATLRFSPLWFLAMAADASRGTRAFLDALVTELRREGIAVDPANVRTIDGLLASLERALGAGADAVDVPPLDVRGLRETWEAFRSSREPLPTAGDLMALFRDLQSTAAQSGRSLLTISSLSGLGATASRTVGGTARTTLRLGRATARVLDEHIVEDYRRALADIRREGVVTYATRISRPYLAAARRHFDPRNETFTERRLRRTKPRRPPAPHE